LHPRLLGLLLPERVVVVALLTMRLERLDKAQAVVEMDFSNPRQAPNLERQTQAVAVEEGVRQTHTQMVGQAARVLSSSNTPTQSPSPTPVVASPIRPQLLAALA
jgi:hypothetical protein